MIVLTENNEAVDVDKVMEGSDLYFCVLDFAKPKTPDYQFKKCVVIETYDAPIARLRVGPFEAAIPWRWSVMITYTDQAEVITVRDLIGRDYEAFCINPLSGYMPERLPIRYIGCYESAWTCPRAQKHEMFAIPIGTPKFTADERKRGPICLLAGENLKVPETIDVSLLW